MGKKNFFSDGDKRKVFFCGFPKSLQITQQVLRSSDFCKENVLLTAVFQQKTFFVLMGMFAKFYKFESRFLIAVYGDFPISSSLLYQGCWRWRRISSCRELHTSLQGYIICHLPLQLPHCKGAGEKFNIREEFSIQILKIVDYLYHFPVHKSIS